MLSLPSVRGLAAKGGLVQRGALFPPTGGSLDPHYVPMNSALGVTNLNAPKVGLSIATSRWPTRDSSTEFLERTCQHPVCWIRSVNSL
mmetsp:Transcript_42171/g.90595  ORF Transcript_42171/g.90595 Transcript_42171/m.90595 type:complete len:88 (+) Transcript_42171:658-921(+)